MVRTFCWHTCVILALLFRERCKSETANIESGIWERWKWECAHRKWSPTACSLSACRQAIAMQQTVNTPQSALARLDKGKTSSIGKFLNEMDWLSSSQFSSRYMICRFVKAINVPPNTRIHNWHYWVSINHIALSLLFYNWILTSEKLPSEGRW